MTDDEEWRQIKRQALFEAYLHEKGEEAKERHKALRWIVVLLCMATIGPPISYGLGVLVRWLLS